MSSKLRKSLALVLCLALCLGLFPAAYAEEAQEEVEGSETFASMETTPSFENTGSDTPGDVTPAGSSTSDEEETGAKDTPTSNPASADSGTGSFADVLSDPVTPGSNPAPSSSFDDDGKNPDSGDGTPVSGGLDQAGGGETTPSPAPSGTENPGDEQKEISGTPSTIESGNEGSPSTPVDQVDTDKGENPVSDIPESTQSADNTDPDKSSPSQEEKDNEDKDSGQDQDKDKDQDDELVSVVFETDDREALVSLTVTDSLGSGVRPVVSPESGEPLYGSYLLAPGDYRYRYHDEDGKYEDLEEDFTVVSGEKRTFFLDLKAAREGMCFSLTYVNPIYADVVGPDDIPEVPITPEESLERMQALVDTMENGPVSVGPLKAKKLMAARASGPATHDSVASAAEDLRSQICDFASTATIRLTAGSDSSMEDWSKLCMQIFSSAIAHTGVSTQGDYIRYEYGGYDASGSVVSSADQVYYEFIYSLYHYTNAEQEAELTPVVNGILGKLALAGKSDVEKVQAIYGYLCDNVSYGGSSDLKFTAYSALINHQAVCQGIATAFYRLCLESGIDTRVVTSTAMGHAWNIAKVDGAYYAADVTWDLGYKSTTYRFFLRGSDYWLRYHKTGGVSVLGDEFASGAFSGYYFPSYDHKDAQSSEKLSQQEALFPDEGFRTYLITNFDTDKDGLLSEEELAAVTQVDLSGVSSVSSLQGLELLPALESLNCAGKQLSELDLSQNQALRSLDCSDNQLTALDLRGNTALTVLRCGGNPLIALDVSTLPQLQTLDCRGLGLSALDLSRNTALASLDCSGNALSSLSVSTLSGLTELYCGSNNLTNLDVSALSGLTALDCSFNPLSAVNLPEGAHLTSYIINGTGITSLDISRFTGLTRLGACVAGITSLDVSGCPALIAAVNGGARSYTLPNGQSGKAYGGSGSDYVLLVNAEASVVIGTGGSLTLTYDPNGGVGGPEPYLCNAGDRLYLSMVEPTRGGYQFDGWALSKNAAQAQGKPGTDCTMGDSDVVLYAVWKPNTYRLHFNASAPDGLSAGGSMADQTLTYGKSEAIRANAFKVTNYTFDGWALEPGGAKVYADRASVTSLTEEYGAAVELYATWKPLATGIAIAGVAENASIDMAVNAGIQLSAVVTPGGTVSGATWKASPSSVATVDASGYVRFVKPGTVTVTATTSDGTKKSTSVRFTVYYLDTATKLTAALSPVSSAFGVATGSGLQAGDSAQILVYGADKSRPLTAPLDYTISTSGGSQYLSVSGDGTVTSLYGGKSVAVKAALRGDPLRRSVSITIKTITPQVKSLTLSPVQSFEKLLTSTADQTFTLRPAAVNALGKPITLQKGMFTYKVTAGTNVASVRENTDGTATVTLKRNQAGSFTVTATAKDLVKASASYTGTVVNYTPVLSAKQVNINSYYGGSASVNIVFQYGNALNGSVRFYDNNRRAANSYSIAASTADNGNGTATVTLRAGELLPNKAFTGQLYVPTLYGEYWLDLKLVSKNTLPTVSVSQATKFNLFYRDSEALFNVSASGGVKNVTLQSDVFAGVWQNGRLTVRYRDDLGALPSKINTRATLLIEATGYNYPVAKTITIGTVTTKPSYKLDVTSGTYNTAFGSSTVTVHLLAQNGAPAITADTAFAPASGLSAVRYENGSILLTPSISSGKLIFYVQQRNWAMPLSFTYNFKGTTTAPKLTPAGTLNLNGSVSGSSASTALRTNQTNTDLSGFSGVLTTTSTAAKGKISVVCSGGVITATVTDPSVKAGSYTFSGTPSYNGRAGSTVKVTVKVTR